MGSESLLLPDVRIVLIGKVGAGKTSVINSLKGKKPEHEGPLPTEMCQRETVKVKGQSVVVVDTPGLCNKDKSDEKVLKEIRKFVRKYAPFHVFLLVLNLDPFTDEEERMVETIKEAFCEDVLKYTFVLFTNEHRLKQDQTTIEDYLSGKLDTFVKNECGGRYGVIDNKAQDDDQVARLLQKINAMQQENKGQEYTAVMIPDVGESAAVKRKVTLAVGGGAVAGASVGGAILNIFGSTAAGAVGSALGAFLGGALGAVGVIGVTRVKAKLGRTS